MNNVILITCKFSENVCLSEERILDIFISSNKEQFSIDSKTNLCSTIQSVR